MRSAEKIAATIVLVLSVAVPAAVEAQDYSNTLGLGAESAMGLNGGPVVNANYELNRIPGASVRYRITRGFGLQLIAGARLASSTREDDPMDRVITTTLFGLSLRGHIIPFTEGPVHFGIVLGVGYASNALLNERPDPDQEFTLTQTAFEVGIRPEWFVTEWLSFHTQVGLTLTLHGGSDAMGNDLGSTTGIGVGRAADLLGNAGFTFWFAGGGGGGGDGGGGGGGGGGIDDDDDDDDDGDDDDDDDDDGWNYGEDY